MTTNTLKPCPHCGGRANMTTEVCADGGGRFAYARCSQCEAKSREHYHSYGNDCPVMYQTIRDEWNARVDSPALLAAEELADAVDEWGAKGRTEATAVALNTALGNYRAATGGAA